LGRARHDDDYATQEHIQLAFLQHHPSSGGWEYLADMSVGHAPFDVTMGYYDRAIEEARREFAGRPATTEAGRSR
jgi:hypothetical protein